MGYLPKLPCSIWLHAESLGEMKSCQALITALQKRYPVIPFVITTHTKTGFNQAYKQFGSFASIHYVPLDWPTWTRRVVARINPIVLLSVENAIWPNRFRACAERKIPVLIVNAKIGTKTLNFYQRFPKIAQWLTKNIFAILASSRKQADNFQHLNIPNIQTLGELKLSNIG